MLIAKTEARFDVPDTSWESWRRQPLTHLFGATAGTGCDPQNVKDEKRFGTLLGLILSGMRDMLHDETAKFKDED